MKIKILFAFALVLSTSQALAETLLERGEYLVRGPMGCGNCHTPLGPDGPVAGQELTGRLVDKNEAFTAIAPNITPAGRIAEWSDAQLAVAIREGKRPDGSTIGPPMPFAMYRGLSDNDLKAVVAFLRTLPSVESDVGESEYNIELPPAYGPPVGSVADIPRGITAQYGAYLAGPVAHCMECHTPMGPNGPMLEKAGQGGFEFHGPWGVSIAPNITPHEDGLAEFTDSELAMMITQGKRPDGTMMLPPMPYGYLAQMTDDDMAAIIAYLRVLPPLPDPE
ncbi:MAG: c-type cytochrome [Rhizobiaceae bacterium]|nr:c-type cytochrome [Rhizobiaceae bacterium]